MDNSLQCTTPCSPILNTAKLLTPILTRFSKLVANNKFVLAVFMEADTEIEVRL